MLVYQRVLRLLYLKNFLGLLNNLDLPHPGHQDAIVDKKGLVVEIP